MSVLAPDFWPWFWMLVLAGATVTAALCLVVGLVATRRGGRRAAVADAHDVAPTSVLHEHHRLARR
jgi:hypothetical protein